jgi:pyruvate dehydrogenase E2 component (dihydrolipoamide acetyltransferase)
MPITVTMPALSPTMTEGTLARWLVKEGDTISAGDVIAEIETDTATMEVETIDDGRIGRLLVAEGTENVAVNEVIAVILEEDEDDAALAGFAAGPTNGGTAPAAPTAAAAVPEVTPVVAAPAAPIAAAGDRVFASPLARRMAEQAGLDLAAVKGSGPNGRIVKRDIEAALSAGVAAPTAAPTARAPAAPTPAVPSAPVTADYEEVPLNAMRKTIARRLTESKQTVPHFYLSVDCTLDRLLELRKDLNSRSDAYKISVNDFVIRAVALALKRHPDINSQWAETALLRHRRVDVAVAVALPNAGLITPVVRDADRKGLAEIAGEMKDLAARARDGKLMPEDYQGGTFSISNLGMFGIDEFVAVINPPQAGILAVGTGKQRPVVMDGAVAVATVMTATLSADHRVFGGAEGAAFLDTFRQLIEDPLTMLL